MERRSLPITSLYQSIQLPAVIARVCSRLTLLQRAFPRVEKSNKKSSADVPIDTGNSDDRRPGRQKRGKRQPAKVILPTELASVLQHVDGLRYPERNKVMVLLSFKAGLRACEIAGLEWEMVLGSDGAVSGQIVISRGIAKGGSGRFVPTHCDLQDALDLLHQCEGHPLTGHVIRSERQDHLSARSGVNWFSSVYHDLRLVGCSSHSGRRTFITTSARVLAKTGGSLRDIQELAGHRALTTTERYIEGDRAAQRRLIELL